MDELERSSPPTFPGHLWIVLAAVALAAVPAGATAAALIFPELGWRALVVGPCTAAMSVVAVRAALRRACGVATAAMLAFAFAVIAAVANAPLSFAAISLTTGEPELMVLVPVGLVFATVVGAIFAVPVGALLGALFAVLAGAAFRLGRLPSHDAPDLTLRLAGAWLCLMDLACYAVVRLGASERALAGAAIEVVAALAAAGALAGLAAAAVAQASLHARRSWLRRVRAGLVDGWVVLPRAHLPGAASRALRPLLTSAEAPAALLCRRVPAGGGGAYRAGADLEPVALVD